MEVMRHRVKLDMEDSGTLKTQIRLKQGDSAITLVFKIMKNGVDVYSASDIPTVVFKRPDGTSVVGNMSVAEGQYTYTMAGNELQIAGPMTADVKFDVNTARESTCTFGFECVPDTMSPDTNPAGIFVNSLKDIITAVQQGVEKVEQAVEVFDVQQIIDLKNQIEELIEELPDITIDSEFDTTSEHALQNKVIAEAIDTINDALDSLATVATSGSYNDLGNKPTLSAVATSGSYNDLSNKPTLAAVATSGSYSDLSNKPTIPADVSSRVSALEGKAVDVDVYSSSTSYTVGTVLYYSGKLYKVKTACSGVTPPNTTYYDEYTLTSELSALNNSLTQVETYHTSTGYTITKIGKVCILSLYDKLISISTSGWNVIDTIPAECKPIKEYRQIMTSYDGSFTTFHSTSWSVTTDCKFRIYTLYTNSIYHTGELVWITE